MTEDEKSTKDTKNQKSPKKIDYLYRKNSKKEKDSMKDWKSLMENYECNVPEYSKLLAL